MNDIVDQIMQHFGQNEIGAVAARLGIDPATAEAAIGRAVPLIVGGMANNAGTPESAGALHAALSSHAGSVAEALNGVLGGAATPAGGSVLGEVLGNVFGGAASGGGLGGLIGSLLGGGSSPAAGGLQGGAILGGLFGDKAATASRSLGQATGLDEHSAGALLSMLAPVAMSAVAHMTRGQGLSADGLGQALAQQAQTTRQGGGVLGDLLGTVFGRGGAAV